MKHKLFIILGIIIVSARLAIGQKPMSVFMNPSTQILTPITPHIMIISSNSPEPRFVTVTVTNPPVLRYTYPAPACEVCGQVHHQMNVSVATVTENRALKGEDQGKPFEFLLSHKVLREITTTNEGAAPQLSSNPNWQFVPYVGSPTNPTLTIRP